jgi:hypothetical protein
MLSMTRHLSRPLGDDIAHGGSKFAQRTFVIKSSALVAEKRNWQHRTQVSLTRNCEFRYSQGGSK